MPTESAIDTINVTKWLRENIHTSLPPYNFELIPSGQSNLTFIVTDSQPSPETPATKGGGTKKWVLRRPPLHQVLATAHDMEREFKIISALHPVGFPVPEPLALCTDTEVNTYPFFMMEYVDGLIIADTESALATPMDLRAKSGPAMAKTLAQLHSINPDDVGLSDFAKKTDYISRQLRRWLKQFKQSQAPQPQEVEELHDLLADHIPPQKYTGIVHGDYRLDNCVLNSETGDVEAVLDWELCTLGDTLADLGILCVYWAEPTDQTPTLFDSPTKEPGFASREELLACYQKASGKDLANIDFYLAFGCWRLVCILQGVYSRYLDGAMSDKTPPGGIDGLQKRIKVLLDKTSDYADKIG